MATTKTSSKKSSKPVSSTKSTIEAPLFPAAGKTAVGNERPVMEPGKAVTMEIVEKSDVKGTRPLADRTVVDSSGVLERLGRIQSLSALEEQLKDGVKLIGVDNDARLVQSDHYLGTIAGGGSGTGLGKVNIEDFLKLCKQKGIKQDVINTCLSVTLDKVNFLSEVDLNSVREKTDGVPVPYKLTVTPRKDVPAETLIDAVNALSDENKEGKIPAAPEPKKKNGKK